MHEDSIAIQTCGIPQHIPRRYTRKAPEKLQVRVAKTYWETEAALRLRHEIFYKEMGANESASLCAGMDLDIYDQYCDHLIVLMKNEVVGTYRMLPAARLAGKRLPLYSENEFAMTELLETYQSGLLELGRSCVRKDHRNGLVPRLLWSGILQYAEEHNMRALCGCVSLHHISHFESFEVRRFLQTQGYWNPGIDLPVTPAFECRSEIADSGVRTSPNGAEPSDRSLRLSPIPLPPLLKGYLNMGATICGGPAWDREFKTHDFLVLFDTENISEKHKAFFKR